MQALNTKDDLHFWTEKALQTLAKKPKQYIYYSIDLHKIQEP